MAFSHLVLTPHLQHTHNAAQPLTPAAAAADAVTDVCDRVVSSMAIAVGFYSNETANKGLERSVNSVSDIVDTVTLVRDQVVSLTSSHYIQDETRWRCQTQVGHKSMATVASVASLFFVTRTQTETMRRRRSWLKK